MRRINLSALTLGLACILAVPALGQNANPRVFPPGSMPSGSSYAEWSGKWWRWALDTTVADSPLLDTSGANCSKGQSGGVWFLAGTMGATGPVTRSCNVPAGKSLFFPVANAFCSADFDPPSFDREQACA